MKTFPRAVHAEKWYNESRKAFIFHCIIPMHAATSTPVQSLFSYATADRGGERVTAFLTRMETLVSWEELAETLSEHVYTADTGRPGFPITTLTKCLFLAQWYGLSDPELEDQIRDRLSFQRFLGITAVGDIPDETTLCRFRNKLIRLDIADELFTVVQQLIDDHGVRVKRGTIVDATIIAAPKGRKRVDGSSTRDTDAGFTKKNGKSYHGYKQHIATDTKGQFIQRVIVTSATPHDSTVADALIHGETIAVFGDSAYVAKERRQRLRAHGIYDGTIDRAYRNRPLSEKQHRQNRKKSSVRCRIEHAFAWMKGRMGYRSIRYRGLQKNTAHALFVATAYNLKRLASVLARAPVLA